MSELTINGQVVSEFDKWALERIVPSDSPLTKKTIFTALDSDSDGQLTNNDFSQLIDIVGCFTDAEIIRNIVRKYGCVFVDPAFPDDIPKSKRNPEKEIIRLLKQSDFLFVGEAHTVHDEKYFISLLEHLKPQGLTQLAIEVSIDFQDDVTQYLSTGDSSNLSKELLNGYLTGELQPLIQAAYDLGIYVQCIDKPQGKGSGKPHDPYRDQHMAEVLLSHADRGKTLVWTGASHANKDNSPYPTVRWTVENEGYDTRAIKLESANNIKLNGPWHNQAFFTYLSFNPPKQSLFFNSTVFKGGSFLDSFHTDDDYLVRYKEGFDAVMFLSEEDSLSNGF